MTKTKKKAKPKRFKFTISRRKWWRGHGADSELLRADGKMCCVGIYLKACGIKPTLLKNVVDASDLAVENENALVKKIPTWLLNNASGYWQNSDIAFELYAANDEEEVRGAEKEKAIKNIFATHGVDVTFVS